MKKKLVVATTDTDGKDLELAVMRPTPDDEMRSAIEQSRHFSEALKNGSILRISLDDLMKKQGAWTDENEKEYEKSRKTLLEGERKLKAGGIKLQVGIETAKEMVRARQAFRKLISKKNLYDVYTAEGQAENASFNYLVSKCTVYNETGKPYFTDLQDYLDRMAEQAAVDSATALMQLKYGLDEDFESKHPEWKFLKRFKKVNDKLQFVRADGKLTDIDGKLINENNELIDEQGNTIDIDGNRLTPDTDESKPFLDDEGQPIEE